MDWGAYTINEHCHLCGKGLRNKIVDRASFRFMQEGVWICFACAVDHSWVDKDPMADSNWNTWNPEVQFWTLYEWWTILRYRRDRQSGMRPPIPAPVDFHAPIPTGQSVRSMARLMEEMA